MKALTALSSPDLTGKTILQVIPTLNTGGAERTTLDIAEAITKAGGRALVASAGGLLVPELEELGGIHFQLPLDAKLRLDQLLIGNVSALKKLCKSEKVDLIHARSRGPAWSAKWAADALNLPFVTTYHGIYGENNALKKAYNKVMVSGTKTIANSNYTATLIKERYNLADEKIAVIHRGTDVEKFDPEAISEDAQNAMARIWGTSPERPTLLLLGRLTDWKGHFHAITAFEEVIAKASVRPQLVFAGAAQSESYEERLRTTITEKGFDHDIHLVGHVADTPTALSLADVVLSPSTKAEAFGRSIAEAEAMAKPVIAFDHGGATETIIDNPEAARTSWRVPLKDDAAFVAAILEALEMPSAELKLLGQRARKHIAAHFDLTQMCEKTLHVYAEVLL